MLLHWSVLLYFQSNEWNLEVLVKCLWSVSGMSVKWWWGVGEVSANSVLTGYLEYITVWILDLYHCPTTSPIVCFCWLWWPYDGSFDFWSAFTVYSNVCSWANTLATKTKKYQWAANYFLKKTVMFPNLTQYYTVALQLFTFCWCKILNVLLFEGTFCHASIKKETCKYYCRQQTK